MVMGSSNLMMGLTLVLVVCLAVVLGLVLVLLAELYCSILLRRRHTTTTPAAAAAAAVDNNSNSNTRSPSLTNLYAQSVIAAPRDILYPSVAVAGAGDDIEKQQQLPQPPENQENGEHLVYISNPMYDGDENGRHSRVAGNTPFETPDTSPSRLETEETSSGDDDDDGCEREEEITSVKVLVTPPLSPMKKLPAAVNDGGGGGGAGGGGCDLNSNNGVSSSSSSGTPCTSSLSW